MTRTERRPVPTERERLGAAGPEFYRTPPLEKDVQAYIVATARKVGFTVRSTSQYRASHVSEGFADLFLAHRGLALVVWWETKTYDGKAWRAGKLVLKTRSPAQLEFAEDMAACRVPCGWGAVPEFYDYLVGVRLAERTSAGIMLRPWIAPRPLSRR